MNLKCHLASTLIIFPNQHVPGVGFHETLSDSKIKNDISFWSFSFIWNKTLCYKTLCYKTLCYKTLWYNKTLWELDVFWESEKLHRPLFLHNSHSCFLSPHFKYMIFYIMIYIYFISTHISVIYCILEFLALRCLFLMAVKTTSNALQ